MTPPRHLARTAFVVECPDGGRRHHGQWTDPARAQHWADNGPCCNQGDHTVVPVIRDREVA